MKKILFLMSLGLIILIFRTWFLPTVLVGGDTVYIFSMDIFRALPYVWDIHNNNGFGSFVGPFLNAQFFTTILWMLGNIFHLDWSSMEKIVFLFPEIIIGCIVSILFTKHFIENKITIAFAPVIFLLNTYFLLLMAGGQFVVAFAYVLMPYFLYRFALLTDMLQQKSFDRKTLYRSSVLFGLVLGIEMICDLRLSVLGLLILFFWGIYKLFWDFNLLKNRIKDIVLFCFGIPVLCILFLHSFWIFPTFLTHTNPLRSLGKEFSSIHSVQYFSFAKFENSIGLLHPNWPENIFGFTHFMKPEFLILPFFAFSSLLFLKRTTDKDQAKIQKNILFFILLSVLGIFLGKGTNDPFGGIYLFLFQHVPGFAMFRDATKWYSFIVIGYLILITFSIEKVYLFLSVHKKFHILFRYIHAANIFLLGCIIYFVILLIPAIKTTLPGMLSSHSIPKDYITLEKFLASDTTFSRVLWVPSIERFGYFSTTHPAVNAVGEYNISSAPILVKKLQDPSQEKYLQERSITYIIVPVDSEKEIFISDRKYNGKVYKQTLHALQQVSYIHEHSGFGSVHVFMLSNTKDHFWIDGSTKTHVSYRQMNPTEYTIQIQNGIKGDRLIFTDAFDTNWRMESVFSKPFDNSLNSFVLQKSGDFSVRLWYEPQKYVWFGFIVSFLCGGILYIVYIFLYRQRG